MKSENIDIFFFLPSTKSNRQSIKFVNMTVLLVLNIHFTLLTRQFLYRFLSHVCCMYHFLSFLFGWRRQNLITGLSAWCPHD